MQVLDAGEMKCQKDFCANAVAGEKSLITVITQPRNVNGKITPSVIADA